MKAIRIHAQGGPDVMRLEDVPVPEPGVGQAVVRLEAIGVNFIDVYHRTGLYKVQVPFTPGQEGAGVVTAVGNEDEQPSGFAEVSLDPPPVAVATAHPSSVLRSRQREVDRAALVRDLAVARGLLHGRR